jgi:outer membrane protein assembly factor BamB
MINLKNKNLSSMIALILMFSMSASIMLQTPVASAHTPAWTIPTNAYNLAVPSTIGLGDSTTIVMWVDQNPPSASGTSGPRWEGCKLEITKPDGNKETIGPFTLRSATASDWISYTPDELGTYTIVFTFPGQTLANMTGVGIRNAGLPYVGDYFAGSTSQPSTFTVQQERVKQWESSPLPTEYWQRPINDANREWSVLASNWLKGSWLVNEFQRWGTAPESAHILWTQPITPGYTGGINDAAWAGIPSDVDDYENPWSAPIIMNGKIYYNSPRVSDNAQYGYYCMDLATGQQLWYKNGTDNGLNNPWTMQNSYAGSYAKGFMEVETYMGLTQGWLYHYYSVNGQGILEYLIMVSGSTWYFLDATTGNWVFTLKNVPSGTAVTDQDGSLLAYSYNANTGNLLCWNVSQAIPPPAPTGTTQQMWRGRFGLVIDAVNDTLWKAAGTSEGVDAIDIAPHSGYTMNLTVAAGLPGGITVLQDENRVPKMIFGSATTNTAGTGLGASPTADTFSAWLLKINENAAPYSPYPTKTNTQNTNLGFGATILWNKNFTVPITGKNYTWSVGSADYGNDIFILSCKQTMQRWGYKLSTGELLWGPTATEGAMNYYGMSNNQAYGMIYGTGYAGTCYAYDAKTGELRWTYNATSIGYESPYGDNYPLSLAAIADGKLYLYSNEHSPTKPLWRGSSLRCINATDGTEIWKLLDFNMGLGVADGLIVTANEYDNNIYCIGKGPSEVTVTASPKISTNGDNVLIEGTVTDISPGTKGLLLSSRFPNGVPAVADESMGTWMEYLYEQQAMPTDAKGVEVTLDAVDPNGNFVHIGTVTSDSSGMFKKAFTPEVPGEYTIIASFAGSKSYYTSYAETAIAVSDAPATLAPTAAPVQSMADLYFVPVSAGIIVAIIIVGAVLALLMLRKRP